MRGEYDKDVCCLVEFQKACVCAAKQSTFMGQYVELTNSNQNN